MATILLCEADADVRRLLALLLERLGHEVVALEPRSVALPQADVMILEPVAEACLDHARRARVAQPGLPILCVSVLPDEGRFLELGPLAYLAKPFALGQLRDAVDRALALAARAA